MTEERNSDMTVDELEAFNTRIYDQLTILNATESVTRDSPREKILARALGYCRLQVELSKKDKNCPFYTYIQMVGEMPYLVCMPRMMNENASGVFEETKKEKEDKDDD